MGDNKACEQLICSYNTIVWYMYNIQSVFKFQQQMSYDSAYFISCYMEKEALAFFSPRNAGNGIH